MLPIAISPVVLASPESDASRDGFFDTFVTEWNYTHPHIHTYIYTHGKAYKRNGSNEKKLKFQSIRIRAKSKDCQGNKRFLRCVKIQRMMNRIRRARRSSKDKDQSHPCVIVYSVRLFSQIEYILNSYLIFNYLIYLRASQDRG